MRPLLILFALFIYINPYVVATAASYDCAKATTWVEKMLCEDNQLSQQDELLTKLYRDTISTSKNISEKKIAQQQWLKSSRNVCMDIVCLGTAYSERIQELKNVSSPIDDVNICRGNAKDALDLASVADDLIANSFRRPKYGQMNDGSLNFGNYWLTTDIALLYARLHCWQSAGRLINKIESKELLEISNASLSIEHAKAGNFEYAINLLNSLHSEEAATNSAYGIAEGLVLVGRDDLAKDIVMRVTTRDRHLESPSFQLISAFLNANRINDAERAIENIPFTWNEHLLIASACMKDKRKACTESHINRAISVSEDDPTTLSHVAGWAANIYISAQLFDKAQEAITKISYPLDKLQALLRLAESLNQAKLIAKSNQAYSEVFSIIKKMKRSGESDSIGSACTYIAGSYGKIGAVEKVKTTVALTCPDPSWKNVALMGAIKKIANRGNISGALNLQALLNPIFQNDADDPIAVAEARKGEFELARVKTREIRNDSIRLNAVRHIAAMTPSAIVITGFLDDSKTINDGDHRAATVQVLTALLARSKSSTIAMQWLEPLSSDQIKARGYLGIAQGLMGIVPGTGSPDD